MFNMMTVYEVLVCVRVLFICDCFDLTLALGLSRCIIINSTAAPTTIKKKPTTVTKAFYTCKEPYETYEMANFYGNPSKCVDRIKKYDAGVALRLIFAPYGRSSIPFG